MVKLLLVMATEQSGAAKDSRTVLVTKQFSTPGHQEACSLVALSFYERILWGS